jgi:hypothetical protein
MFFTEEETDKSLRKSVTDLLSTEARNGTPELESRVLALNSYADQETETPKAGGGVGGCILMSHSLLTKARSLDSNLQC